MGKQPIICEYLYLFIINYPESHTLIMCSGVLISHVTGHDIFNFFFLKIFQRFMICVFAENILALQRIIQLIIVPQHMQTF